MVGAMDERLTAFAEAHHGLFRTTDAEQYEIEARELSSLHRAKRIERVGPLTYRMPGSPPSPHQTLLAAVWVAGDDAVAGGWSAAWLHDVHGPPPRQPEVVRLGNRSRKAAIGRLRQTTYLPAHHRWEVDGIPVLSPARMILELLNRLDAREGRRLIDRAERRRLARTPELRKVLAEAGARGRAGTAALRAILLERDDEYTPTDSELEDLCLAVLEAAGFPIPVRQLLVGGSTAPIGRIDLAYLALFILIECDSKRWHDSWEMTMSDHRRDALLRAARWLIIRTNWWQLTYEPKIFLGGLEGTMDIAARAFR